MIFNEISIESISLMRVYFARQNYKLCNYSGLSVYTWKDFFHYRYAIEDDVLYIMSVGNDTTPPYFLFPLGTEDVLLCISKLKAYCENNHIKLQFNDVPKQLTDRITAICGNSVNQVMALADYLYTAESLAVLKGSKFAKKRKHILNFIKNYSNSKFEPINAGNLKDILSFYNNYRSNIVANDAMYLHELDTVPKIIENFVELNAIGIVLYARNEVVGFVIGEIVADTLMVHIEKVNHEYVGASEMINMLFVRYNFNTNIKFVNREDDAGNEGLRKAKQSYHPLELLAKYNIFVNCD